MAQSTELEVQSSELLVQVARAGGTNYQTASFGCRTITFDDQTNDFDYPTTIWEGGTLCLYKLFYQFLKANYFIIFYKKIYIQWKTFLGLTKFYVETNAVKC